MRTQEAFTISILDCANRLNLKFSRLYTNREGLTEYVYHCPMREKIRTPLSTLTRQKMYGMTTEALQTEGV